MLKEFMTAVLDDCFEIWKADGNADKTKKDFAKEFNEDMFDELVDEIICKKDEELWYATKKHSLYVMCLELLGR